MCDCQCLCAPEFMAAILHFNVTCCCIKCLNRFVYYLVVYHDIMDVMCRLSYSLQCNSNANVASNIYDCKQHLPVFITAEICAAFQARVEAYILV